MPTALQTLAMTTRQRPFLRFRALGAYLDALAGGFRDLVVLTLDEGGDPRELRTVGLDLVRRLTAAG